MADFDILIGKKNEINLEIPRYKASDIKIIEEYDRVIRKWLDANLVIYDYKIENITPVSDAVDIDLVISGIPTSTAVTGLSDALILTAKDYLRIVKSVSVTRISNDLRIRANVSLPIHVQKYAAGSDKIILRESTAGASAGKKIDVADDVMILKSSNWGQDVTKLFGGQNKILIDVGVAGSEAEKLIECSNAMIIRASFKFVEHDIIDPATTNSLVLDSTASIEGVRFRMLSQMDPMTLAEFDSMKVDDLDIIII